MVRIQVSGSKLLITSMSTKVDKVITAPKNARALYYYIRHPRSGNIFVLL